jgi:hypothetical protein
MTGATTLIIAIIALLDGVAASTATPCTVTSPSCGITIFTRPTDFVVNVSDPVDPSTVQASDLRVNGAPADSVVVTNGNTTITFHFGISPVVPGRNTMGIPAGAFDCGPVVDFTCEFRCIAPRGRATPRPRPTPPL